MESENIASSAAIKLLSKDGANAEEIHRRIAIVYGDGCPKYTTAVFKRWRDSLEDNPMPGRPTDVISQEMIETC